MSSEQPIRVYCPTHKTSFYVIASATLLCQSDGHTLAHNFPYEDFWEYCCDCQSFRPSEIRLSGKALEHCLVCTRQIAHRFLCDRCHVLSVESAETSTRRKSYVINISDGVEPHCPACNRSGDVASLQLHTCREVEATFITARAKCPFCDELTSPEPPRLPTTQLTPEFTPHLTHFDPGATQPLAYVSVTCPHCRSRTDSANPLCDQCGHPLSIPPPAPQESVEATASEGLPQYELPPFIAPTAPKGTPASSNKWIFIVLGGIAGFLVLIGIVASLIITRPNSGVNLGFSSNSSSVETTESKLERAIARDQLVSPPGTSAYDYYRQLKQEGAGASTLAGLRDELVPLLKEKPERMLAALYEPGSSVPEPSRSEWEDAAKMLTWASELMSNDTSLVARALFCEGRVAYLSKNKDEALRLWRRASALDEDWPLPPNGIGLIYNDQKNVAAAQSQFAEAIRRDSQWAVPHNNLGNSYRENGDPVQARAHYERAVSLAPRWGRPHAWLGDMAMKEENYERAMQEYKTVLDLVAPGTPGWDLDKIQQMYDRARLKLQQPSY